MSPLVILYVDLIKVSLYNNDALRLREPIHSNTRVNYRKYKIYKI